MSKEICTIEKETYEKFTTSCSDEYLWHLIETTMDSEWQGMVCEICNRYWDFTDNETELKQQIICFCGKMANQFPCETCPTKNCCIPDCDQIVYEKSISALCHDHFRCKICKGQFRYQYASPYYNEYLIEWIDSYCDCGKENDRWEYCCEMSRNIKCQWPTEDD
jgi:hypothetical protein